MSEVSATNIENAPERVDLPKNSFWGQLEDQMEVNNPESDKESKTADWWKNLENDYLSTYEERIKQTPTDKDTGRGRWEEGRGESKYIPTDERIKEILSKYDVDGIEYKDGIPDFSRCSESTVEIDEMSENRQGKGGNFEQADQKCAEQWNKECRDGKTDWTARDVKNFRKPPDGNGASVYTWHECNDRKTCQLLRTEINDYFGHLGGVGECNKANAEEAIFDE